MNTIMINEGRSMDKILLFIPMYNCEKQIVRVLGQLTDEVCGYLSEVIIVNNRSTDNGEQAVIDYLKQHSLPIKVSLLRNDENYGLGGSHKVAFQYAIDNGFDYVIVLHGDDQASIEDIIGLLSSGEYKQHDCCMGARFLKESQIKGYSRFRTLGNMGYNLLFSVILLKRIPELGSSLKLYKTDIFKNYYYYKFSDTLSFDYCMTLASGYYKQDYLYFPMTFREEDQVSNVKLFKQALFVLKLLLRYAGNPQKFITSEMRESARESYTSNAIYIRECDG